MPSSPGVDVSIVLPCFNAEEFLDDALDRLLAQKTELSLEVIVVDDASGDTTAAIAARRAERDGRVVLLPLATNGGVARAREAAVSAARGNWIWMVDADDAWSPDAVATLVAAAVAEKAEIVCAGAVYVQPGSKDRPVGRSGPVHSVTGVDAFRRFLRGEVTGHLWNKLFARDLFGHIEFTDIRQHSDQAMVAQLLLRAGRVTIIPDVVYRYQLRAGSIIRSGSRRADSLRTLASVVGEAARAADASLTSSRDFHYYLARFSVLSRMKDAVLGGYSPAEERAIIRGIRSEISWPVFTAPLVARDGKRSLLMVAATVSTRLYRRAVRGGSDRP